MMYPVETLFAFVLIYEISYFLNWMAGKSSQFDTVSTYEISMPTESLEHKVPYFLYGKFQKYMEV